MPRTLKAYQQRWHNAVNPDANFPAGQVAPWDEELTPTSCVIYESSRSMPESEGCNYFLDFGDVICYYLHLRLPEEMDAAPTQPQSRWMRYRSRFMNEEIRRRHYEGARALDKLLRRFVCEGYQPALRDKLIEIVNGTLIDFELHEVYVLPGDLDALLRSFGNPLVLCDCDDDGVSGTSSPTTTMTTPAFDLSAQGHREALAEHLIAGSK